MEKFKTLLIGATLNPDREAYHVMKLFGIKHFPLVAIGLKEGMLDDLKIDTGFPAYENIHTITLYVGAKNQVPYYDYIVSLKPKRLIFNPGAENKELLVLAKENGIDAFNACTRTMLTVGNFDK